ncbi:MAG: GAF domain-containing protein [Bacteroidales bacterium]|nr:GAF domain-containing protein [Bacteroidales bacterium]MBN2757349.1 GAF domain-containing protein [Bacteroidales bacterium]
MGREFNLSIKNRFLIFIGIIILAGSSIIFMFIKSINDIQNFNEYHILIDKLEIEYLSMRRFEQHFLVRFSEDPGFFKSGNNKYLRKHKSSSAKLTSIINDLKENSLTEEIGFEENIDNMNNFTKTYYDIFSDISNKIYLKGTVNTGIIGSVNLTLAEISDFQLNNEAKNKIWIIDQNIKDFLLYKDNKYAENFMYNFSKLNDALGGSNFSNSNLSDDSLFIDNQTSNNQNLIKSINNLKKEFVSLIKLDNQIGLNSEEGLHKDLRTEIHKLDPEIEFMSKTISEKKSDLIKRLLRIAFILTSLIIVIILYYAFSFLNSITGSINKLNQYIQPLSKGILPDELLVLKQKNELSDITVAINELIVGLKKTTNFAETIGRGKFDKDFQPLSNQDVLGNSLIEMRENLLNSQLDEKKRQEEDSLRKWSNEGLAKFSEILRQSAGDIDILTSSIVRNIVNFLNANQSGLFLINDSNKEDIHLELIATYAYNHERKKQKKIYIGEGLIGMCAVEKSTVHLDNIPEGYLSITSGLGGSNPKSLLIVPLKLEDEIFGVIEIASFNNFQKHEVEFVERVSESISSTLSMTKINTQTANLLSKSQRQAEEMASQEEEMRQNFEELKATQEESARREAEMSSIIQAINNSSLVVEFDLNGYIINANQAILDLLNLTRSDMVGKHQSDFEKMEDTNIRPVEFWENIKEGKIVSEVNKISVSNKVYWLHEVYTPITDANGKPYKILNLATDITESKELENELVDQAEQMAIQEEELRRNLQELEKAQKEMTTKQKELENANEIITTNEKSLQELVEKAKIQERRLRTRNAELAEREVQFKKEFDEMERANKALDIESKENLEELKKLRSNEKILKKFLNDSKEAQKKLENENLELLKKLEASINEIKKLKGK